jgi:POT family proton-dependent oligopeptide transporter
VRHEISVAVERDGPTSAGGARRTVVDHGQVLAVVEPGDGSVQLRDTGGETVRRIPKGEFTFGSTADRARVWLLLVALSLVAVGNGLFKPNVSTMVGSLYPGSDTRRDAGFTIFYMGINLGSVLGQFLCPFLADTYGWGFGFAFAGCGMLVAWVLVSIRTNAMAGVGAAPDDAIRWAGTGIVLAMALAVVPLFAFALSGVMQETPTPGAGALDYLARLPAMGKMLLGTFAVGVPAILIWARIRGSAGEFRMMLAAMILVSFNTVFWSLFEQAGSSLTLFADRNTDRSVFGWFTLSAPQTQNFNSLSIILLAPLVSMLWGWMARRGWEPSVPVKFALALAGAGGGFLLLVLGCGTAGADGRVGLQWLAGLYVLHSLAELLISPVGLSMITGLAMARVTGLMMGVWFLSMAMGEYVAGLVAQMASVAGAGEALDAKHSLAVYSLTFARIGWAAMLVSIVLLAVAGPLGKLMRGARAWAK